MVNPVYAIFWFDLDEVNEALNWLKMKSSVDEPVSKLSCHSPDGTIDEVEATYLRNLYHMYHLREGTTKSTANTTAQYQSQERPTHPERNDGHCQASYTTKNDRFATDAIRCITAGQDCNPS